MATTLGALDLPFAHVEAGTFPTAVQALEFPGVDYVGRLDMGKRERPITITGFIVDAISGAGGATKGSDIEGLDTGAVFKLTTGIGGREFSNCRVVEAFCHDWRMTLGAGGAKQSCNYTIKLEQLKP